jgi:hypothetical protein
MAKTAQYLTINEASIWTSGYIDKNVSTIEISNVKVEKTAILYKVLHIKGKKNEFNNCYNRAI